MLIFFFFFGSTYRKIELLRGIRKEKGAWPETGYQPSGVLLGRVGT